MKFDMSIKNQDLTIYSSKNLGDFSNEFIIYYNENIERIKNALLVKGNIKQIVAITDDESNANFVYGKSSFSGFFNNTGSFAYINLNGDKTKDYMFKGLMHELTHHLYKYHVYGAAKERITWVDEGLAQLLSGQKEELQNNTSYQLFLEENLKDIEDIDLNELNHNDRSFGNKNGYNLSYIAIRYLYETTQQEEFADIIRNEATLKQLGEKILRHAKKHYSSNGKQH